MLNLISSFHILWNWGSADDWKEVTFQSHLSYRPASHSKIGFAVLSLEVNFPFSCPNPVIPLVCQILSPLLYPWEAVQPFSPSFLTSLIFSLYWPFLIISSLKKKKGNKRLFLKILFTWFSDHHMLSPPPCLLLYYSLDHSLSPWPLKCQRSTELGLWSFCILHSLSWYS